MPLLERISARSAEDNTLHCGSGQSRPRAGLQAPLDFTAGKYDAKQLSARVPSEAFLNHVTGEDGV